MRWPKVNADISLLTYCEAGSTCGSIRPSVRMTDSYQSTATAGVEEAVMLFVARCRETRPPSRQELEEALDQGLGRLFLLEAWLREAQQPGTSAGEQGGHRETKHEELLMKVATLRSAIQELRAFLTPGESPLAYGFVSASAA